MGKGNTHMKIRYSSLVFILGALLIIAGCADNKTINRLNANKWFETGRQAGIANRWNEAIDAFNKALELNPKYAAAYYNRGAAYYYLGSYNQAIADYNKAIELNMKDAMVYYNRGSAYYSLGKYDLAIADYDKAIELDPKSPA